jgi:hypothetical protein
MIEELFAWAPWASVTFTLLFLFGASCELVSALERHSRETFKAQNPEAYRRWLRQRARERRS